MMIWLFRHFGFLEVLARRASVLSPKIKQFARKKYKKMLKSEENNAKSASSVTPEKQKENYRALLQYLDGLGICHGDILIVHTDMEVIKKTGATPKSLIEYLLQLVGEEGTLVFPSYPITTRPDLFTGNDAEYPLYDPKRTPSWTGIIPNVFCMYPDVIRSEFPYNSLAAKGPLAKEMMEQSLQATFPHEQRSSWGYCIEHHAKILFLGAEMIRSNTLNHATEDYMGEEWPIADWYDTQTYRVKTANGIVEKEVHVFSGRWMTYCRPNRLVYLMCKKQLARENRAGGVYVGYIPDSKKYLDEQIRMVKKGWIRYLIPKKYYKKRKK